MPEFYGLCPEGHGPLTSAYLCPVCDDPGTEEPRLMSCPHSATETVTLSTGETVGHVCSACLASLPKEWGCEECEWTVLYGGDAEVTRFVSDHCERHLP